MSVETRRYHDELGRKPFEAGQDVLAPRRTKRAAARARPQRDVDDIVVDAGFVRKAGAGIERILMGRRVEQLAIGLDHGLRALAVMDVEVEHGNAADAVLRLGM